MNKSSNYFTHNLIALRKRCGLKKADIAMMMEQEWHTYFYWESGASHPRIDDLIRLSIFYGVSVDDLLKVKIK